MGDDKDVTTDRMILGLTDDRSMVFLANVVDDPVKTLRHLRGGPMPPDVVLVISKDCVRGSVASVQVLY